MKKADLIKLVENLTDDQEINEIVLGNDEFKNLGKFDITKVSVEDYKTLLKDNQAIQGYHQSLLDSAISKGVNSYEEKTLPKKIEEALKKANNQNKTPEQIALEELQSKFEALTKEKELAEKKGAYSKTLSEKGLDVALLDFCFDESEEGFTNKLEKLTSLIKNTTKKELDTKLGQVNHHPKASSGEPIGLTKEQFSKMGYKERVELYNNDPETYQRLINE